MNFDFGAVFEQLVSSFTRLPLAQKLTIPLLIVASVFAIIFVSNWASRPDYQVLYANIDEADAGAVIEALEEKKVSFKLRDGGKTIDVTPADRVPQLRIELAALGLPTGKSNGYELFNETTLGQTGFVEKINFVRALQGELERTIASIEAVAQVRVHITIPKQSLFVQRDAPPTASVLLKLKAGRELDAPQVKGIAHLVAGSVERLLPENVIITDSKGRILNDKKSADEMAGADVTRLKYKQEIEEAYVQRIESMLAAILGPGRAVARVTAQLDFSRYEKEEESFDPSGQVLRSERSVDESAGLSAEGGVPGVVSNLTNDPGLLSAPDSSENSNLRSEKVRNFEVSRSVSKTVSSVGNVERLTVGVMVDGQHVDAGEAPAAADGEEVKAVEKLYQPLSAEMLRQIENLVKQSVGFDETRGDVVTVENIRFFDTQEIEVEEGEAWKTMLVEAMPYTRGAVMLLLVLLLVKPLINFLVKPSDAQVDLSRLLPTGIDELEAELNAERNKMTTMPKNTEPEVDIEEVESLLAENSRLVRENPQQAALLIRYWLNESGPF